LMEKQPQVFRARISFTFHSTLEGQSDGRHLEGRMDRNLQRRRMAWLVSLVSSSKSHINPSSLALISSWSFSFVYLITLYVPLRQHVRSFSLHVVVVVKIHDYPKERDCSVAVQADSFTKSPSLTIDHDISAHNHSVDIKLTKLQCQQSIVPLKEFTYT
jgi:hypothetical protein